MGFTGEKLEKAFTELLEKTVRSNNTIKLIIILNKRFILE
jgi:hypothetical protein